MPSLAIIGSGIAGLGCAHFLRHDFDLTIFEQNDYVGGHTNTIEVAEPALPLDAASAPGRARVPVDTGFMVFNQVTYPHLTRLFADLGVPIKPTTMSFSVRHADRGIEFAGTSFNHLFAQRRNLLRPRFWKMLAAVDRFNREAVAGLDDATTQHESLGAYIDRRGYGADFFDLYLAPMTSAVWSATPAAMREFPAATLLRFFHNHGLLGMHTQHPWWTVDGGARVYVEKLTAPWRDHVRLRTAATRVVRTPRGVAVMTSAGEAHTFDQVILACHADHALRLLADPTPEERRLLAEFHFQPNRATVHTDASVMPRTRRAWSSWNCETGRDSAGKVYAATHYWMNSLQGVSDRENYFVSLNAPAALAPERILRRIDYEHPLFTLGAMRAQPEIPGLNAAARATTRTYFAGAWQRYGFHEDGLFSAVRLCEQILGRDPWPARPAPPANGRSASGPRPAGA